MANQLPPKRPPFARRSMAAAVSFVRDRNRSFRLIVYGSVSLFVALYVFTVKGVETLLADHFEVGLQQAVQVPDLHLPAALQIQQQIDEKIRRSPWVRLGGVRATVIVMGQDGRYIYVGGRAVLPPPTLDPAEILREAQRLLPATGEVIVSVPHNTLLSNAILLAYTAILLQGLFVYNRYSSRRGAQTLEHALRTRDDTTRRAAEIQIELDQVREHLLTVEPTEKEYTQEIKSLQFERQTLQRKISGLAAREEELRGKAARAVELDQEIHALEDLLEEAGSDISSKDEEIGRLESSLKKASKAAPKTSTKSREADQLSKRLRTLYPQVEFTEKAVDDLIQLRDETMKLKAEEAIKRLSDEAENVSIRRKVGGLPSHLSIFELGFAGKGRIYYSRGRQQRFLLLTIGAKNTQKVDLEYLSRLPK